MSETNEIIEYQFTCTALNGMHARPANRLEQIASGFACEIIIENLENGKSANARSILSVISADIKLNDKCLLKISGEDSEAASKELVRFIEEELPVIDNDLIEDFEENGESYISPVLSKAGVEIIPGRPVTAGIGRGHIVYVNDIQLPEEIIDKNTEDTAKELELVENAFASIIDSINREASGKANSIENDILQAHLSITHDQELKNKIKSHIAKDSYQAGRAIIEAFRYFAQMLGNAQSQVIRDRIADLNDIRNQLIKCIYGQNLKNEIVLNRPSICVAECMSPSEFISLNKSYLKGLVLKEVGSTSHIVILARSCDIPILTDVQCADLNLPEGQEVILDSNYGLLIPEINESVTRFYDREMKKSSIFCNAMAEYLNKDATTKNGKLMKVMANIAMASEVEAATRNGANGIGLYRTEMMLPGRESAPGEQEQFEEYKKAVSLAAGKVVSIRTFDIGGDKNIEYIPLAQEQNPYLGNRGVRIYKKYKELLHTQLSAILRASAFGAVQLFAPMVACREEVLFVKEILEAAKKELDEKSIAYDKDVKLGIMIEVPSAAFIIPQLSDLIDFINIGTNDLKQYFFAADRENKEVSSRFPDHNPAFLGLLDRIITDAHRFNLPVCLCGEMGSNERYLPLLIGAEIDSVSVSTPFINKIKALCSQHDSVKCRSLLDEAVACKSSENVTDLLDKYSQNNTEKGIIEAELIDLEVDCINKEEVIKYITDTLYLDQRTSCSIELEKDFWKREEVYSTGLGHGFAIPHCKTSHISQNSICVFRLQKAIEWQSIDEKPVKIIIAMTIRDSQDAGNSHMTIFSKLARNIMHTEFQENLKNLPDKASLVDFLRNKLELTS